MCLQEWTAEQIYKYGYVLVNKILGECLMGQYYKGFLQEDETKQVAVKIRKFSTINDTPKMRELIRREIKILLGKISHPNFVRVYDVIRTDNYHYMFLEYCADGDLKDYMTKKEEKRLCELEALVFIKHIVEGLKFLQKEKIIHHSIKPKNIWLHNREAKLTGFEFAEILENDSKIQEPKLLQKLGDYIYMAPQILEGKPYSSKCDAWSLGITFYELLYGTTPWKAQTADELLENIKKQKLEFPVKPFINRIVKDLIAKMLKVEEADRIQWEEIFESHLFKIELSYTETKGVKKKNQRVQQKEKISQCKSIEINLKYLSDNLVAGYYMIPIKNQEIFDNFEEKQVLKMQEPSVKQVEPDMCINDNKKRYAIQQCYYSFLLQRNMALFHTFVIKKIIKMQDYFEEATYFRLIYIIMKNQIIHLESIKSQLKSKQSNKYDKIIWEEFINSNEYVLLDQLVFNDFIQSVFFYDSIAYECKLVQRMLDKEQLDKTEQVIQDFLPYLNGFFGLNDDFQMFYADIIKENITALKDKNQCGYDVNLLILFLLISLNPQKVFDNIYFDFQNFYLESEGLIIDEIQERIKKLEKD